MWTTDAGGMRMATARGVGFLGQKEDETKGWGWLDAVHPEDREQTAAAWSYAVRTCSDYQTEFRILREDGEYRNVLARGVPLFSTDGSVREWIGGCTDITERKRAEQALEEKAAELARSNADLQRFAYIASHDLQEPLRMVVNFTQLLADRYASQLDDDAREFIGYATRNAIQMQTMIQDLLAYSRTGGRGLSLEPVDCNEILERVLFNLQVAISECSARVTAGKLPVIRADATQMVQLFQNLIGNAIKFRSANAPEVQVAAVRNEENWVFSVAR